MKNEGLLSTLRRVNVRDFRPVVFWSINSELGENFFAAHGEPGALLMHPVQLLYADVPKVFNRPSAAAAQDYEKARY